MNPAFWQGKRVFLTGHTGFKGSWMSLLLQQLGAEVTGFALPPDTHPALFKDAGLPKLMASKFGDIRNAETLESILVEAKPEIVLHLAAQAIVSTSYDFPVETLQTNILGTANLLQAVRNCATVKAVVVVTSDKCYENHETGQAYQEHEALGGKDPYSASKACTEIVSASWRQSFFNTPDAPVLATARAGNVIGGGDWSRDRLVPDMIRAFMCNESVLLRSPNSVRPWQHVLEPLAGYLTLAEHCVADAGFGQAWNFGPDQADARAVREVADTLVKLWGGNAAWHQQGENPLQEAGVLKLDSSKARSQLHWQPVTNIDSCLQLTAQWYQRFAGGETALDISREQIKFYLDRSSV